MKNTHKLALFGAAVLAAVALVTLLPQGLEAQAIHQPPIVAYNHPNAFNCKLSTTATTSTQVTGCEVVAGKSYYITGITVSGDIANATATPWILQSGTSTACTGPAILDSGYHPALSTVPVTYNPPIKATVSHGICLLDGVTGTKKIRVTGYLAP